MPVETPCPTKAERPGPATEGWTSDRFLSRGFNLATASELSDALVRSVVTGSGEVGVDLSAVTLMDSTGLGALVQWRKRLAGLGRVLTLRRRSQRDSRLLEVSRLSGAFTVED